MSVQAFMLNIFRISQRFLYKYQISASFYGKIKFVRFHFDNDDHFYSKDALLGHGKRDFSLEEH